MDTWLDTEVLDTVNASAIGLSLALTIGRSETLASVFSDALFSSECRVSLLHGLLQRALLQAPRCTSASVLGHLQRGFPISSGMRKGGGFPW